MPPARRLLQVDCCLGIFSGFPCPQRGGRQSKATRRRRPAKNIRGGRFGRLHLRGRRQAVAPNGYRIRAVKDARDALAWVAGSRGRARRPPAAKSRDFAPLIVGGFFAVRSGRGVAWRPLEAYQPSTIKVGSCDGRRFAWGGAGRAMMGCDGSIAMVPSKFVEF